MSRTLKELRELLGITFEKVKVLDLKKENWKQGPRPTKMRFNTFWTLWGQSFTC